VELAWGGATMLRIILFERDHRCKGGGPGREMQVQVSARQVRWQLASTTEGGFSRRVNGNNYLCRRRVIDLTSTRVLY